MQSVERAMRLLVALAESPSPATLQQLTQKAGGSTSSASRILATMSKHDVVAQDPVTRKYRLGSQLAALAHAQASTTELRDLAAPHLRRLRDLTNETAILQGLVGTSTVCLAREESPEPLRFTAAVGQSWPLSQLGATSRALLAFLDDSRLEEVLGEVAKQHPNDARFLERLRDELHMVRHTGVARTRGERLRGAASVAVPVFDGQQSVCGALTVPGPNERMTAGVIESWEPKLRQVAEAISRELGYRGMYPGSGRLPRVANLNGADSAVESTRAGSANRRQLSPRAHVTLRPSAPGS